MKTTRTLTSLIAATTAALLLVSCGGEKPDAGGGETSAAADPAIDAIFLEEKPEGAISVLEARKDVKPGETITVAGRVAGAMSPFTEGYATFVLADETLETCERIPGDECRTPWDACCVAPETIKASRLTLQIVGEDGRPVAQGLKGVRGMKELDSLVVTGTVAEGSTDENLIVNVNGLYQAPADSPKGEE